MSGKRIITPGGNEAIIFSGFDYPSFKLFLLSILWRAGVASRGEYQQVKLGRHEEILRRMLREQDPGKASDYPCMLLLDKGRFRGMGPPVHIRFDEHRSYRFLFGRVLLWFVVSSHFVGNEHMQGALQENGVWIGHEVDLRHMPEWKEILKIANAVDVPDYLIGR